MKVWVITDETRVDVDVEGYSLVVVAKTKEAAIWVFEEEYWGNPVRWVQEPKNEEFWEASDQGRNWILTTERVRR